jgi:diguanylate cyclase (GGDEF)-like protein
MAHRKTVSLAAPAPPTGPDTGAAGETGVTAKPPVPLGVYGLGLMAVWTLVVAGSLWWNLHDNQRQTMEIALNAARINFDKDLLYRRWAAALGGVYALVTPGTPPNPYLAHIPERDLLTPSGRQLTLINPAYMTRQVYTLARQETEIRGHLTSLKPLRPENAADSWETLALKSFEQGKAETFAVAQIDGREYLRLMRPFNTEKSCLKCHATQGYKEGDIRGGISVSIPLAPLRAISRSTMHSLYVGHGLLWLLGMVGLGLGQRRLTRTWRRQQQADADLQEANRHLKILVEETRQRNREISLINDLADQLHACFSVQEAYQVIVRLVPQLFPATSGALFILNSSKNYLEGVVTWGESPPDQLIIAPQICWALRRGRTYHLADPDRDIICEHVKTSNSARHLCVPLVAQGDSLGVLHLSVAVHSGGEAPADNFSEDRQRLVLTVAEHLSLSLANLKLQETLRYQAIRDPLTGLFNRRFMEETLGREISRVYRKATPLGIIMMDLDHFKHFNDTFGHVAGDVLLSALGSHLRDQVRKEDVACRFGGEEFILILPDASLEVTCQRAEELRSLVHDLHIQHQGQTLGGVTISMGVAVYPDHGDTPEGLIRAADAALYRAKGEGRDRVCLAGID